MSVLSLYEALLCLHVLCPPVKTAVCPSRPTQIPPFLCRLSWPLPASSQAPSLLLAHRRGTSLPPRLSHTGSESSWGTRTTTALFSSPQLLLKCLVPHKGSIHVYWGKKRMSPIPRSSQVCLISYPLFPYKTVFMNQHLTYLFYLTRLVLPPKMETVNPT